MDWLQNPLFLLAVAILGPLLRDFVVKALRGQAYQLRHDKDPKNDNLAVPLDAAADVVEKIPTPPLPLVKPK